MKRFEEALVGWQSSRLSQSEAALLLGVCERTFRRQIARYEADGLEGLLDKRISQASHRLAPVDEVMDVVALYRRDDQGWNVKHFHGWYQREHGGQRSDTWVKQALQAHGAVVRAKARGKHRKRRERAPLPGMLVPQDASTHLWVPDQYWDLVVTLDDATGEHLSMCFCEQEGTLSSLQGVSETIARHGLFCSLYTDRGRHYFHTPEAGGKVDRSNPTQFGRALAQLGIEDIAAYSPEARGRSERAFGTHQQRLPQELAKMGITEMAAANAYLQAHYLPGHNAEFTGPAAQEGSAFVAHAGGDLSDILCEQYERVVGQDNCVRFEGGSLQIPADGVRHHYIKRRVRVHRHLDRSLSLFYGPRRLGRYDAQGAWMSA